MYQVAGIKKKLGSFNYLAVNKQCLMLSILFDPGATASNRPGPPYYREFTVTFRHTTLCGTSLDA